MEKEAQTLGERIKLLRKNVNLTQQELAEKVGTTQNVITNYERGNRNPTGPVLKNICHALNANEDWLRTGEGDPHPPVTREAEIAEITATLFRDQEESFRYRLIKALSAMDEDGWKYLEQIAEEVVNIKKD